MHINACRNVWLGYITCGLLEKLPHDMMMHAFLHGVLMLVIEVIMSPLVQLKIQAGYYCWWNCCSNKIINEKRFSLMQFYLWYYKSQFIDSWQRAGVAFIMALVAASKPDSGMMKKAARRIQWARKRGQKVNAEIDENGNTFADGTDDDDGSAEIIMLIFLRAWNILQMLEMLLTFHAWYKRGHPFSLKTPKEKEEVMKAMHIIMWQIIPL